MSSVNPDYEYDIFVSYRQNDNRSGWVTEFVDALREELAATIKHPVSVYFDNNPVDGLLETHHVDKSLQGKLNSLILLPILSQTYCDTGSFAWQHEFCAFNRASRQSKMGRDIQLGNGNVSSRILPVKIHDLDPEDRVVLETELESVIRGIDFIYREPGVNRPLKPGDSRKDNQNKTDFGNQVNKVANAIKEILNALRNPATAARKPDTRQEVRTDTTENSIAVLPFANLNDASQEYFADGITENIIGQLSTLPHLRVISRTSIMRYKKTTLSAPAIADELNVRYLLEGSAQLHGQRIRIQAQLIDPEKDQSVWSKTFVESYDDLFAIQDSVSTIVARELLISIGGKSEPAPVPTRNLEAYDLFLKGRHAFNQWGLEGYREATGWFERAIEKDPEFQQAYSYLASSYSARMSWNGDLSPAEAVPLINKYLEEAWRRGATDNDYLTRGFVELFVNKNAEAAQQQFREAVNRNPSNALALFTWCYALQLEGNLEEAKLHLDRAGLIEPRSIAWFSYRAMQHYFEAQYVEALQTLQEAIVVFPGVLRFYDLFARTYLARGKFKEAIEIVQKGFNVTALRPPSMVAYLANAHARLGDTGKVEVLQRELVARSEKGEKGVNVYVMHIYVAQGMLAEAADWHAKALATNDVDLIWWKVDPLLKPLRESQGKSAGYALAERAIVDLLEQQMPKLSYHNVSHIKDVLQAAIRLADTENVQVDEVQLLRLAALLHDAGYIRASRDHEMHSAQMARELLPNFGLEPAAVEKIVGMIQATKLPQSPNNQLERILCDADLDYLGREDYPEISAQLYEELKQSGAVSNEAEWIRMQVKFLESHQYHTVSAKKLREPGKQERLQSFRG